MIGKKMVNKFRIALIQLLVTKDKQTNLQNALKKITEAKNNGAQIIALPECFNSPYGVKFFSQFAEQIPNGETSKLLSKAASDNNVFIIGGTIPERDDGEKFYNTCTVWNSNGELVAKYRKIHLFDIDIPGGITFKESDSLLPGNQLATFEAFGTKFGIGICYDIRFPLLAQIYRNHGCNMLIYPGAFNLTTGPMHWELLQRARAVDNQIYVATISPARSKEGYIAYGHSMVIDPWAKIIAEAKEDEEIIYADIDICECEKVQQQIPISKQTRSDIYGIVDKSKL